MIDDEKEIYRDVLPKGFSLHWYEVQSVLGRGAFGVTYLARDKNLDQFVAIKEYFPNEFSTRESGFTVHPTSSQNKEMYEWGLNRFVREARTLAKFKHGNIVRVLSVFENNNTAYMIMEYERGKELSRLFKEKKHFAEQELLDIFLPIMEGLKLVHDAGFIHRDIKPSNIYIREDGSPVLIDFGSARQVSGAPTRALTSLVTYGYAPFEQYNESEEKQGPWTDVYALGASLFFGLMHELPVESLTRGSNMLSTGIDSYRPLSVMLAGQYSTSFLLAIDHALLFHANERPQDVLVWADMLRGKKDVPALPASMPKKTLPAENPDATVIRKPSAESVTPGATSKEKPATEPQRESVSPSIRWKAILLILVVVIAVGTVLLVQKQENTQAPPPEKVVSTPADLLLGQAIQAYQADNYILPEGNNALQFYLQLLMLEPTNEQASKGVAEIIRFYDDSIRNDLAEEDFNKAGKNLQRLLAIMPESEKWKELQADLEKVQYDHSKQRQLLAQADEYLKNNNLLSPIGNNALSTLRKMLEFDPGSKAALQRVEIIASHYINQAEKEIASGKLTAAHKSIRNIKLVDVTHPEIERLNSMLVNAKRKKQQQELALLISQAKKSLDENNLLSPSKKNAFYLYQQVLKQNPQNTKAKRGLERVRGKLEAELDEHLKKKNFSKAELFVKTIETSFPGSTFARSMRAKWDKNKLASKSDVQIIEEMIGNFKQAFESQNQSALEKMSELQSNRKGFISQLIKNYQSFKVKVSNVRIIGKKKTGQADIKLIQLVNLQGLSVQPGAWSQFGIDIKKNKTGEWKIYW